VVALLQTDTAETGSITLGGGREWRLPTDQKVIPRCRAAIGKCTDTKVLNEPVVALKVKSPSGPLFEPFKIKLVDILAHQRVYPDASHHELALVPAYGSVAK
jgi:hypothetical protein